MTYSYYDIIIVGGGISGLYSAYKLKQMAPHLSFMVLEAYKKKFIGGRMSNRLFYGTFINNGAGVGRKKIDLVLQKVLHDLKVPYEEYIDRRQYATTFQGKVDVESVFRQLFREYKKDPATKETFKQFGTRILGPIMYKNFVASCGYSDYEDIDLTYFFYKYGFEYMLSGWVGLKIPWRIIVKNICEVIGHDHIRSSQAVTSIEKINNGQETGFYLKTKQGHEYGCSKVIIGITIDKLKLLLPFANAKDSIYQQIHGRTFLRMYGKFDKASNEIMKQVCAINTIVPGPIYKIIPMDLEKGVYQIAYNDSSGALFFKEYLKNTPENRTFWCRCLEVSLGLVPHCLYLIAIENYFWDIAIHYYEPLHGPYKNRNEFVKVAQHPMPGMLIVGEMVSQRQGWTEGALESVEAGLTKTWLEKG